MFKIPHIERIDRGARQGEYHIVLANKRVIIVMFYSDCVQTAYGGLFYDETEDVQIVEFIQNLEWTIEQYCSFERSTSPMWRTEWGKVFMKSFKGKFHLSQFDV